VAAVEHVVGALGAAREATDAAQLAERPEALEAAREQLVRVGLVAGIPHDVVARAVEESVEGHGDLDHFELPRWPPVWATVSMIVVRFPVAAAALASDSLQAVGPRVRQDRHVRGL
jgi:hypothetical protein